MRIASVLAGLLLSTAPVQAQEPATTAAPLDEIVVMGEFPGPGMWKVTLPGDSSRVLWIVGDPWPLPKRWKWKSSHIEATLGSAQELLMDSSVSMQSDEKIGFFRGMALLPAVWKARRNPEEARLEDVLPPQAYARWQVQKKLYLGRESGVERWRPLFAADKLRKAAFDGLGMREGGAVREVARKLAEKRKLRINTPTVQLKFKRSELRDKIREFSKESLADRECFETTLSLTEALANRDVENARARAWAAGDIEKLAALPALPSPYLPCAMAVMNAQVARETIPADIAERVQALWVEAAAKALETNTVTLAVVPFGKLTRAGGYLDRLRARGFTVEAPN